MKLLRIVGLVVMFWSISLVPYVYVRDLHDNDNYRSLRAMFQTNFGGTPAKDAADSVVVSKSTIEMVQELVKVEQARATSFARMLCLSAAVSFVFAAMVVEFEARWRRRQPPA